MNSARLEIAVQNSAGVAAALAGGADRVELCQALELGGLTPSLGLVRSAADMAGDRDGFVNVLIRPRPGGYIYSADELSVMCRDIEFAADAGAHGVVIGALTEQNKVDSTAMQQLLESADGLVVTFHRALDVIGEPVAALRELGELGVDRVLTSGGALRCIDGLVMLGALAEATDRVEIMAGGGIEIDTIPELFGASIDSIHLSAKVDGLPRGAAGPGGGIADSITETSPDIVAAARKAVSDLRVA